jgi:hypothetical protein
MGALVARTGAREMRKREPKKLLLTWTAGILPPLTKTIKSLFASFSSEKEVLANLPSLFCRSSDRRNP